MALSFHDTQVVRPFRHRIIALFRPHANCREIEVRQIGIGTFGGVRLPEYPELASGDRARQTRGQEAVIIVGIDPNRTLRGIVAMICRSAPHRADISGPRAADGAGKQHDADVSRLPVDREAAVGAMAGLPPRHKAAIFSLRDAFEISR